MRNAPLTWKMTQPMTNESLNVQILRLVMIIRRESMIIVIVRRLKAVPSIGLPILVNFCMGASSPSIAAWKPTILELKPHISATFQINPSRTHEIMKA